LMTEEAENVNLYPFFQTEFIISEVNFFGVKIVKYVNDLKKKVSNYSLIVSAQNFHSYEMAFAFDYSKSSTATLTTSVLRCYLRYAFYEAVTNKI